MVNGYKNTASNVQHVSVIGSGNTVKDTDTALLLGDNRTLSGATNSLVIGSADNVTTTDQQNVVVLGHNANATVAGGVALGSESLDLLGMILPPGRLPQIPLPLGWQRERLCQWARERN